MPNLPKSRCKEATIAAAVVCQLSCDSVPLSPIQIFH